MKKLNIIKTYYESNIAKGLEEYGILGWESEEAQRKRFDVLLASVDLNGKSLLDVGCGTGNLLEYINIKKIDVSYTGVDILNAMTEIALGKQLKGEFHQIDIFKSNIFPDNSFDVIYASGIFNLNLGNNKEFLIDALKLFLKLSIDTVVFNLLHYKSPDREDEYFYFNPDEVKGCVSEFAEELESAEFVEDYLKNDFTVILKKK